MQLSVWWLPWCSPGFVSFFFFLFFHYQSSVWKTLTLVWFYEAHSPEPSLFHSFLCMVSCEAVCLYDRVISNTFSVPAHLCSACHVSDLRQNLNLQKKQAKDAPLVDKTTAWTSVAFIGVQELCHIPFGALNEAILSLVLSLWRAYDVADAICTIVCRFLKKEKKSTYVSCNLTIKFLTALHILKIAWLWFCSSFCSSIIAQTSWV